MENFDEELIKRNCSGKELPTPLTVYNLFFISILIEVGMLCCR